MVYVYIFRQFSLMYVTDFLQCKYNFLAYFLYFPYLVIKWTQVLVPPFFTEFVYTETTRNHSKKY